MKNIKMTKNIIRIVIAVILVAIFIVLFNWLWIEDGKMLEAERQALIETGERQ